jgi:hypothetical protein
VNDSGSDPAAFVAVMVNVAGPATVGIPDMTPVAVSRVNPAGSAPAVTLNVIGPVPEAATVAEYGVPITSPASVADVEVIDGATGGAGATFTVYASASDPALLVAVIVNEMGPAVVGVPDTTPEIGSRVNPSGSSPADTV